MKFKDKVILLISPEPWDHLFVSKHHYAIYLGNRDNKVFFLNPPSLSESVISTQYENVYSVNYKGFPRGLRFYPFFIQQYFIRKEFDKLQKRCGVLFEVVWSFDNSVFFDFSALPNTTLKICHIVDSDQNFQFKSAASTADYCFCVTEFLKEKLSAYNSCVFKINHGYAVPTNISTTHPVSKLPGEKPVKVMYAGNLEMPYIDWKLVYELVSKNRNVDFCFAGSKTTDNQNLKELSVFGHVHYLGKLSKSSLNTYLELADVMLLTYRADEFKEQLANSHKVMEYLATGKVTVATYTDELKGLHEQQMICMSNTNAEFCSLFSSVLRNLSEWNSAEKMEKRKRIAGENTYDKQIDRIESIIRHD